MSKPMTKQEWLSYIEKTWDTAQREAWGETPRKGAGMTRDEINRLIQDNELFHGTVSIGVIMDINHLERLVDLVTAAEREECAKLCEEEGLLWGQRYAASIRARGQA